MSSPTAFVLAAGLGTRLAPLTDILPKPLVPIYHKPLVTFALDSLMAAGVGTLALNTHHLPEKFTELFGVVPTYRGQALQLFHEPLLLDTGGGIRNARSALGNSTFFLYNGDILADLPLQKLLASHRASGALATLLLRDGGGVANVRFDVASGEILDMRGTLGVKEGERTVYSGIAVFEPAIFDWIPEGRSSIIDVLLDAKRVGERIGGMLVREKEKNLWLDIGTPEAYLKAHQVLADPSNRPSYVVDPGWPEPLHPGAKVDESALLEGTVVLGAGARVGARALLRDSILWPGSLMEAGSSISACVVRGIGPVVGTHQGVVL